MVLVQLLWGSYSNIQHTISIKLLKVNCIWFRVLVGKPEGKRRLGSPGCRWEDNITMDLQEVGCGGMDWTALAQDRASDGHMRMQY